MGRCDETAATRPLDGVTVLELGQMFAGPWVGRVLADFGATVIKVEAPGRGDTARTFPPIKEDMSLPFLRMNRGKKSIAVDLRTAPGRALVRGLIAYVDVFVINFKPTTVDAWGLDYESLKKINPRLVYVGLSGYGQTGLYRDRPGFGSTAEGESGLSNILGFPDGPPTLAHFGLADLVAGTAAAFAAAVCLYHREQTGLGDQVDVALYEPMLAMVGDIMLDYTALGLVRRRTGNSPAVSAPVGTFLTKDGQWLIISGSSQAVVRRLFEAMGRPELITDPTFADNASRLRNRDELDEILTSWVAARTRAEALKILQEHEVVSGPVNTAQDIAQDEHFRTRSLVTGVSRQFGEVSVPAYLAHIASSPDVVYEEPPALGEHTEEILSGCLGKTRSEIGDLERQGVVAISAP
jgi:crotonobetainyl-CoA:carnitine CoA-transferase CaiB-like acyl-CoA transferase